MRPVSLNRFGIFPVEVARKTWLGALFLLLTLMLAGCSFNLIAPYSQSSADRILFASRSALIFYQDLLAAPPGDRPEMVMGPKNQEYQDVETQLRVHLIAEKARQQNEEGVRVAENLLSLWQSLQDEKQPDRLSDGVLKIKRINMEDAFVAALAAEEGRKLGGKPAV